MRVIHFLPVLDRVNATEVGYFCQIVSIIAKIHDDYYFFIIAQLSANVVVTK